MKYENSIQELTNLACPSIRYRLKKEICGEDIHTAGMDELQRQILQDEKVVEIFSWKQADGWLGGYFHGEREPESGIRCLCEKGVEGINPIIQEALEALIARGDKFADESMGNVGKPLDALNLGGTDMVKACVFAYAGYEQYDFVQEQVKKALVSFSYVADLSDIHMIYREYDDKVNVFMPDVPWPSIYHLRLLAFTNSWRDESNKRMLIQAFAKLAAFSPIPPIKLFYRNQIISPASAYMNDFAPDMEQMTAKEWMMWFYRMELIARLGIANDVSAISDQVDFLVHELEKNNGYFTRTISHYYFHKWTPYSGLALESSWKKSRARIYDLTFRSLLILKLSNRFLYSLL